PAASSSASSPSPVALMRSRISRRKRPGARNVGVSGSSARSYIWCRIWRPISSTSRNPCVVINPMQAPLRSSTALVATVVPCTKRATSCGGKAHSASICLSASSTATLGSLRVLGIFMIRVRAPGRRTTTSVNVPPISTPMLTSPLVLIARHTPSPAGVPSKVVGYPWPTIVEKFKDPNTTPDVSVYWISTYYADPHNWIGEMFSSSTAGTFKNAAHYKNPKVDELLDKALRSTNQAERAKLYEEVTRIVVDDAAGLWIYNTKWYGPYSNKIKGIVFCPIGSAQEMRTAYYESES